VSRWPRLSSISCAAVEDISILTAGQLISEELGIKLENVTLQMPGRAKRVRIDKESTTIIDGTSEKNDIEARFAQIKAQIEETAPDYARRHRPDRGTLGGSGADRDYRMSTYDRAIRTYQQMSIGIHGRDERVIVIMQ
jgi:hypothetical protein